MRKEDLFVAVDSDLDGQTAVRVRDDNRKTCKVPGPCTSYTLLQRPSDLLHPCSEQNPNHESMEVLTMGNQIGGLNKEATEGIHEYTCRSKHSVAVTSANANRRRSRTWSARRQSLTFTTF